MCAICITEFGEDDGAGDAVVSGDAECVAGVVVDPAQDFDVGTVGQLPGGEVGLPAFVGLFSSKADVGRFGPFVRAGFDETGGVQVAADRGHGHLELMVVLRCQAMVWGPASSPLLARVSRSSTIRSIVLCGSRVGLVCGRRERGSNAASPPAR